MLKFTADTRDGAWCCPGPGLCAVPPAGKEPSRFHRATAEPAWGQTKELFCSLTCYAVNPKLVHLPLMQRTPGRPSRDLEEGTLRALAHALRMGTASGTSAAPGLSALSGWVCVYVGVGGLCKGLLRLHWSSSLCV